MFAIQITKDNGNTRLLQDSLNGGVLTYTDLGDAEFDVMDARATGYPLAQTAEVVPYEGNK